MTIEEKARAYDKALKRARALYSQGAPDSLTLESMFPELAESEDERIRRCIGVCLTDVDEQRFKDFNTNLKDCLNWLEKQESVAEIVERCKESWYNEGKIAGMAEGLTNDEKYQQGWHDALEKQGEQKPYKVEPKFKDRDWVVDEDDNCVHQIERVIENVTSGKFSYDLVGGGYFPSTKKNYHLWNIQDAKDGDVLVCPKYAGDIIPNIFIFKDIKRKDNDVFCYCSFLKTFETGGYIANADPINTDFYPATKEQRELLFQKMKEAGYTFDFEKKELKEIEQKPTDKVGQTFNVGDWFVNNITKDVFLIKSINNGYCTLEDIKGNIISPCLQPCENESHLWTIQDAKDSDVLVNGDEIVIFKKNSFNEKDLSGSMFVYCSLRNKKGYWYTIGGINPSNYVPATKAQRDKLFETMKEAGYEWDTEKKELKKINSYCQEHCKGYQETGRCFVDGECEAKKNAKTGWSEKDKKMLRCIGNAITADDASTYLESKDIQVIDAHVWLDELKDRVQPRQEWSEEDEKMIRVLISICDVWTTSHQFYPKENKEMEALKTWLKSLRPQSKQEWSKDDEEIFSEIILRCEKYGNQEQIAWLKSLKERIGGLNYDKLQNK